MYKFAHPAVLRTSIVAPMVVPSSADRSRCTENVVESELKASSCEDTLAVHVESDETRGADTAVAISAPKPATAVGVVPSILLASMYCFFGVLMTLSIRNTKRLGLVYDAAAVVFAMEFVKLFMSMVLAFAQDGVVVPYQVLCAPGRSLMWRESRAYAISSLVYVLYNNMTYLNLGNVDVGTWSLIMQLRIAVTGVLFTVLLKRGLSLRQWLSLCVLTFGLGTKFASPTITIDYRIMLVVVQAVLSALAGVYNEFALKDHKSISIHVQNFFMYFYALLFNVCVGILVRPAVLFDMDFLSLVNPYVLVVIIMGALTGITAAFVLKFINSIVKAFAAAVEALIVSVVGALLFQEPFKCQDGAAIVIVVCAILLYTTTGRGSDRFVHFHFKRIVVSSDP